MVHIFCYARLRRFSLHLLLCVPLKKLQKQLGSSLLINLHLYTFIGRQSVVGMSAPLSCGTSIVLEVPEDSTKTNARRGGSPHGYAHEARLSK